MQYMIYINQFEIEGRNYLFIFGLPSKLYIGWKEE